MSVVILGIESSCDDTSAAVIRDGVLLSNVTAGQAVHEEYGGVVPELASRAHQQNIIPVVDAALRRAGIGRTEVNAVAFTRGPGLLGSLLVGTSLLVSGGNSQIILVSSYKDMKVIGQTIDDAAGEAFDKCAKVMGLPYPGGPHIDRLAKKGDPERFKFSKPNIAGYDYSFSGLKTSFLYTLRDEVKANPAFVRENLNDLCASLQKTVIDILMGKLAKAAKDLRIRHIAVAGGVSANSALRQAFVDYGAKHHCEVYIPKFSFTTDNAAMVAITGYFKYLDGDFCDIALPPYARVTV